MESSPTAMLNIGEVYKSRDFRLCIMMNSVDVISN